LTISKNIGTENIFNSLKNGTILMSEKQIVIKFWKKQNQKKKSEE
jgi:hypothetical protein